MKRTSPYRLFDHCILRMPAMPLEQVFALNERLKSANLNDHEANVTILESFIADPFFREAIFTASRELYNVFGQMQSAGYPDSESTRKMLFTFYKYYARMCSRPTPYGLFAGITTVDISDDSTQIMFAGQKWRTFCQLNIHSVTDVMRNINPLAPDVMGKVKYIANKTYYRLGDRIYYVEQFNNGRFLASNLTSVRYTKYIQAILDVAAEGATIPEMIATIPEAEIAYEKKLQFVHNLIQSRLLWCECWPSVSTEDYMHDFLGYLDQKQIAMPECDELKTIDTLNKQIKRPADISRLRNYMEASPPSKLNKSDFLKINLYFDLQDRKINKTALEELSVMADEIMQFMEPKSAPNMDEFIRQFQARYEDNEIPLTQALDPNFGIGYDRVINGFAEYTPLLEDVPIIAAAAVSDNLYEPDPFDRMRRKIMQEQAAARQLVYNVEDEVRELMTVEKAIAPKGKQLNSIYLFGNLLAASAEALDRGDFRFFPNQLNAPFAARMISRFAHGEETVKTLLRKITRLEQQASPDVIMAEVLTIPDDIYANVNLCPNIRDYEIPYLSNTQRDAAHQILISDLLVSVRNGRVVLRSGKLNREVIPCLSNTYNTSLAQPVYKFLAHTAGQNVKYGQFWFWGAYHRESFLPRIEYKKLILSRARWTIELKRKTGVDTMRTFGDLQPFLQTYHVPRYVVLAHGDNELLLDLENNICQAILLKEVNRYDVMLYEYLFTPGNCFIQENGKGFVNEIVIPLACDREVYTPARANEYAEGKRLEKTFPPGSEWLFVKIYAGSKNAEKILTEAVGELALELTGSHTIDQWFFLRYNDPHHHLRIRFHRHPDANSLNWFQLLEKLKNALAQLIQEEFAYKITVDTYNREIERYGATTMEASERLFYADSVAICRFLQLINGDEGERLRWKFALCNVDALLNDFGYDTAGKRRLVDELGNSFLNEFGNSDRKNVMILIKAINNKYRKFKQEIADAIEENNAEALAEGYHCFSSRSLQLQPVIAEIKAANQPIDALLHSYIHMTLNRMFLVNQRRHEMVVYYLLTKYYESVLARSKTTVHEN